MNFYWRFQHHAKHTKSSNIHHQSFNKIPFLPSARTTWRLYDNFFQEWKILSTLERTLIPPMQCTFVTSICRCSQVCFVRIFEVCFGATKTPTKVSRRQGRGCFCPQALTDVTSAATGSASPGVFGFTTALPSCNQFGFVRTLRKEDSHYNRTPSLLDSYAFELYSA